MVLTSQKSQYNPRASTDTCGERHPPTAKASCPRYLLQLLQTHVHTPLLHIDLLVLDSLGIDVAWGDENTGSAHWLGGIGLGSSLGAPWELLVQVLFEEWFGTFTKTFTPSFCDTNVGGLGLGHDTWVICLRGHTGDMADMGWDWVDYTGAWILAHRTRHLWCWRAR